MKEFPFTNELIHESSPYLLEHAHNPVNWCPWGEKALEKARRENKPLIISIGYAACHWCHVMEHESFSDVTVADYMNNHFVAIKVDREERPDIDQIYMNVAMIISKSGGWPLNAFALPDGKPFYAATYFPKDAWLDILNQINNIYHNEYEKLAEQANNITQGINLLEFKPVPYNSSVKFKLQTYNDVFINWQPLIDYDLGGYSHAPKFALPAGWEFLLQYFYKTENDKALKAVITTLDKMAMGGIYDQIGGFARYSVDKFWKVPHFEKMLYDNGQLVSLYSHAYQITKNPLYASIIHETLEFIERELTSEEGGFYASLNADSEGEEGKFYVFTYQELEEILDKDTVKLIKAFYNISQQGNWEGYKNILYCTEFIEDFALQQGISPILFTEKLHQAKKTLFNARNQRKRPTTDDKILTSWNALMLKGYIDAYRALGEKKYLNTALINGNFLVQNMIGNTGELYRNFKNDKSTIPGFLDDYVLLINAFIEIYQVTFDISWLFKAKELTNYTIAHFLDNETSMFFYTSDLSGNLVARKMEITDNVIPSSNSVMAKNLYLLGKYFNINHFSELSKSMLYQVISETAVGGPYYANWASLLGYYISEPYEIAIVGNDAIIKNIQMQENYLPTSIFSGGIDENLPILEHKKIEGKTMIYVCTNNICKNPMEDASLALNEIKIVHQTFP